MGGIKFSPIFNNKIMEVNKMAKEIIVDEVKEVKKPTNKKIAKKEEVVTE